MGKREINIVHGVFGNLRGSALNGRWRDCSGVVVFEVYLYLWE